MRKLTIIFLFLMVNVWFALGWTPPSPITPPDTIPDAVANMNMGILGGSVPAAGGSVPDILNETWDGAVSCMGGVDTCDNGWTKYEESGTLNADATAPALSGFSGECLNVTSSGSGGGKAIFDLGSAHAITYSRTIFNVDSWSNESGNWLLKMGPDGLASVACGLYLSIDGVGTLELKLMVNDAEVDVTTAISLDTSYRVEIMCNNTAGTWEWYINGASEGSGSDDPSADVQDIELGPIYHNTIDIDIDNFAIDSSAYTGAP